ncbi:hypothetical protein JOB18_049271, partial [Solea senegalensis]
SALTLRFQHYLIPQSTARLRIFWVVDGPGGGAYLRAEPRPARARHALQPMGEPRHDIMVIFREAAAADKVCLHAASAHSLYTTRETSESSGSVTHRLTLNFDSVKVSQLVCETSTIARSKK